MNDVWETCFIKISTGNEHVYQVADGIPTNKDYVKDIGENDTIIYTTLKLTILLASQTDFSLHHNCLSPCSWYLCAFFFIHIPHITV